MPIRYYDFSSEEIVSDKNNNNEVKNSLDRIGDMLYGIRNWIAIYVFFWLIKFFITIILPIIGIASFFSSFSSSVPSSNNNVIKLFHK